MCLFTQLPPNSAAQNATNNACISSSERPLVSGTSFNVKKMVKPDTAENMKKVPTIYWKKGKKHILLVQDSSPSGQLLNVEFEN